MNATLAEEARHELIVRRSRFIALAAPAGSEDEAREALERLRDPICTHNCWAWKVGTRYRFDDDGEPGGTAGRPILQAIESQGFDQIVVLVQRHYGGIKLGTGGLARAYGGCAAECLRLARRRPLIAMVEVICELPFDAEAGAHQLLARHSAIKQATDYGSGGIRLELSVPESMRDSLVQALRDLTRGAVLIRSA